MPKYNSSMERTGVRENQKRMTAVASEIFRRLVQFTGYAARRNLFNIVMNENIYAVPVEDQPGWPTYAQQAVRDAQPESQAQPYVAPALGQEATQAVVREEPVSEARTWLEAMDEARPDLEKSAPPRYLSEQSPHLDAANANQTSSYEAQFRGMLAANRLETPQDLVDREFEGITGAMTDSEQPLLQGEING